MDFYKSNSLYSLQTNSRNQFTEALQKAIAVHPNGHFIDQFIRSKQIEDDTNKEAVKNAKDLILKLKGRLIESADAIDFNRYRMLDINWDDIIPNTIYDSNIELRFVKKMFEDSWGQKPDDKKNIIKFYNPFINVNDYSIEYEFGHIALSSWGISSFNWSDYSRLFENGKDMYLVFGKNLNFSNDIDAALNNATHIVKVNYVKKSILKNTETNDTPELKNLELNPGNKNPIQIGEIPNIGTVTIPPRYRNLRIDNVREIEIRGLDFNFFKLVDKLNTLIPESALITKTDFKTIITEWTNNENANYSSTEIIKKYNTTNFKTKLYKAELVENEYVQISLGQAREEGEDNNNNAEHTLSIPKYNLIEIAENTTVVLDVASGRNYALEFEEGSKFIENNIKTNADWDTAWAEDIVNVELLHTTEKQEDSGISNRYTIGRNEARLILEKYRLLEAEKKVLQKQIEALDGAFNSAFNNNDAATFDRYTDLSLNTLSKRLLELNKRGLEIDQLLNELQSDAAALGYKLFLKAPSTSIEGNFYLPYKHESKAPKHVQQLKIKIPQPGNLYKVTLKSLTWTETHEKRVRKKKRNGRTLFGRRKYKWITVTITQRVERKDSYTSYIPINPGEEMWETHRTQLIATGKHVHVLKKVNGEYVTNSGTTLIDIMNKAIADDTFRKNLVVFIPVYDYSFSAGRVITHYEVIDKPMPGIAPITLPKIHLKEHLEYRKTLAGTELGELSSSIALAPGEKREITYKRSFQNKLDRRKTVKNFLDISAIDEISFEQKLEDEIRTESNESNQDSSGLSLSGTASDGSNSGTASYNENSSDASSLSEFTKNFESTADNAARKYSKSVKEEAVQDISEVISSSNEESVSMSLENINQGVSLNLLFHKLYNTYFSGTFIKDFEVQITHPIEIIQDSGITHKVIFNRKDGSELYEYLKDFISTSSFGVTQEEETQIFKRACQSIAQVIHNDYLIDLEHIFIKDEVDADVERTVTNEIMINLNIKNEPISTHFINLPSKATYVDALLGVNPSTEPYSEAMREEQLRRSAMETELLKAQASVLNRSSQLQIVTDNEFSVTENTGIALLQFKAPVTLNNWLIILNQKVLGVVTSQVQEVNLGNEELNYKHIRIVDFVNRKEIPQRISQ